MGIICVQFICKLIETSDFLRDIVVDTMEYWEPDAPPNTILFSSIGKELARRFDVMTNAGKEISFELIEEGMNSDNMALKTAVATGIIEALVSETFKDKELWSRIESQLGSMSKHHAKGWRNAVS